MTGDMLQVTGDSWHVTGDTCQVHMTGDMLHMAHGSNGLGGMMFWRSGGQGLLSDWMSK